VLGALALAPLVSWALFAVLLAGAHAAALAPARWTIAALLAVAWLAALWRLSPVRAAGAGVLLFAAVLAWWTSLAPSNERDWVPEQARSAWAEIDGPRVTLHDVRDFRYRSEEDFDERWYDSTFDVRELEGIDFLIVHFAEARGPAHTMVSFRFAGDRFVTFSAEVRREKGEQYGLFRGLFRQFELQYVVADERDIVQLRTNVRRNPVHLYRGRGGAEAQRAYFLDMVRRLNELHARPEFYNTLVNNCTTNLALHWEAINGRELPFDHRIVLPGYADDLAFEFGIIEPQGSLEETRRRAVITNRAQQAAGREDFSSRLRSD